MVVLFWHSAAVNDSKIMSVFAFPRQAFLSLDNLMNIEQFYHYNQGSKFAFVFDDYFASFSVRTYVVPPH